MAKKAAKKKAVKKKLPVKKKAVKKKAVKKKVTKKKVAVKALPKQLERRKKIVKDINKAAKDIIKTSKKISFKGPAILARIEGKAFDTCVAEAAKVGLRVSRAGSGYRIKNGSNSIDVSDVLYARHVVEGAKLKSS